MSLKITFKLFTTLVLIFVWNRFFFFFSHFLKGGGGGGGDGGGKISEDILRNQWWSHQRQSCISDFQHHLYHFKMGFHLIWVRISQLSPPF